MHNWLAFKPLWKVIAILSWYWKETYFLMHNYICYLEQKCKHYILYMSRTLVSFPSPQLVPRELKLFFFLHLWDAMRQRVRYQTWHIILQHVREENPNVYQTDAQPACLPSQSPWAEKWESFCNDGWKWLFSQMFCGPAVPHGDGDRGILG